MNDGDGLQMLQMLVLLDGLQMLVWNDLSTLNMFRQIIIMFKGINHSLNDFPLKHDHFPSRLKGMK